MSRERSRRLAGLALPALLATAALLSPVGAAPALAAGDLRIGADATYTVDPDAGRAHVAVQFRVTNVKPASATVIFFYRDLAFGIQPEARAIRASDAAGSLSVTTRRREFFTEVEVHLRANLYFRQTAAFALRYDLVGGAPRSSSPVRIGRAFATFGVWAWGDPGLSTVEVSTPPGFGSQIDGSPMAIETATSGQRLHAKPDDPDTFYAIISAENRAAYGSRRLSLPGDVEIVVMAWPEDAAWDDTVTETLSAGVPKLLELIGLDWPVEHDLNVRERYTPALEGYAGVFFTDEQRIDVSEDLDPVVIMHEASHAWFNQDLFADRWVYEGLADEYAWQVQTAVGGEAGGPATRPDEDDPGHIALSSWKFPEVIRDQETDDRERYGYQAAFWVIHQIVREAGLERMQGAFASAEANRTAYPGAGTPETVPQADSWRRLLDLVEDITAPESAAIEDALRDYVLRRNDADDLDDRATARAAYRDLLERGGGWLPPWFVRGPMGTWQFDDAVERMTAAGGLLDLRDRVADAAADLGLAPDDALRTAYEGASEGLEGPGVIAEQQLAALAAVADAKAKVDAPPDLVASIGLIGETPRLPYEESRAAFERGDLDAAITAAGAAVAVVTGAAAVGQGRLAVAIAVAVAALVLLIVLVVLLRRRGPRRSPALAATTTSSPAAFAPFEPAASVGPAAPLEPAAPEPSGTLGADPVETPSRSSTGEPEVEGGHASGESPAGP